MKKILLLLAVFGALATAGKKDPPLIPSCDPCNVNEVFTINGSGLSAGNVLDVVVVGSPVPVTCTAQKSGSFTCTTSIPLAGTFNIVAYSIGAKWLMIGTTWVTVN
jgi:hypothetical protein